MSYNPQLEAKPVQRRFRLTFDQDTEDTPTHRPRLLVGKGVGRASSGPGRLSNIHQLRVSELVGFPRPSIVVLVEGFGAGPPPIVSTAPGSAYVSGIHPAVYI